MLSKEEIVYKKENNQQEELWETLNNKTRIGFIVGSERKFISEFSNDFTVSSTNNLFSNT